MAARLAEAGQRVLLLEAGGDPRLLSGTNDYQPGINRLPDDYDVPAFHGFASENDAMRWDFFVRHYADEAMQAKDPKYVRDYRGQPVDGVLYPRAGTLGGCTAHNAMILVYPHNADWDGIAQLTGDQSWRADAMRALFHAARKLPAPAARALACQSRPEPVAARLGRLAPFGKGVPEAALGDLAAGPGAAQLGRRLRSTMSAQPIGALIAARRVEGRSQRLAAGGRANAVGVRYTPLTTRDHHRMGTRERVLETAQRYPDRLHLELDALATRVLLDEQQPRDRGRIPEGRAALPRPRPDQATGPGTPMQAAARREVILSGGAFNTPQLLMLSGVGPREILAPLGIPVSDRIAWGRPEPAGPL